MFTIHDLLVDFFDPTKQGTALATGSYKSITLNQNCELIIEMDSCTFKLEKEFKDIHKDGDVSHRGKLPVITVTCISPNGEKVIEHFSWLYEPNHIEWKFINLKQKGVPHLDKLSSILEKLLVNTPGSALNKFLAQLEHNLYNKVRYPVWFEDTEEVWYEKYPHYEEPNLLTLQSLPLEQLKHSRIYDYDYVARIVYFASFGMITPVASKKGASVTDSFLLPTKEVFTYQDWEQGYQLKTEPYSSKKFGYTSSFSDRKLVDREWENGKHYFNIR